ncbi:MAG: hypothetical protein WCE54_21440 [Ignavibacteriaceae bacterium]
MKKIFVILSFSFLVLLLSGESIIKTNIIENKLTICILGGTPSTAHIVNQLPHEILERYNIISFNRPGFGGTPNSVMNKQRLFALAKKAGLKENDFGIIGISGGGPLAILIADKFNLSHCGIISGMVSEEAYFPYADSTFTKPLMQSVLLGFDSFKTKTETFPNVQEIIKQAESQKNLAIRGCFDELNFILSPCLFSKKDFNVNLIWWHGEKDRNVALASVKLFLRDFKNSELNIIPNGSHAIDARIYINKLIQSWKNNLN